MAVPPDPSLPLRIRDGIVFWKRIRQRHFILEARRVSYLIVATEQVLGGSSQRSSFGQKLPILSRQDYRKPSEKPSGDNFIFIASASGCVGTFGSV